MRIAIVGGGVLGASTALHLARAGVDIVLVDAAHEGRATAAGAGIVCPWVSGAEDGPFYRLYAAGARYYPELVELVGTRGEQDLGYARVGGLCVSDDAAELDFIADHVRARAAEAPEAGEVRLLSTTEARALFPPLRAGLAGVLVTGGARVDGRRLTVALLRAARRLGADLREGMAELAMLDGRITGVRVAGETLAADAVVVTAGAWAPAVLRPLGITLPVAPMRGQIVHLRLLGSDTAAWPVVLPQSAHYLLAFEDSRVVAGATRESSAGFDYRVTAGGQAEVLQQALHVAPGLASATVIETRVGFRPASADGLPLLGRVHGVDGLFVGNGLGAAGLTIGPFAGKLLADLAIGRDTATDLRPFDPLRRAGPELQSLLR
ncbi:MAG TPA: FAD-dependent oxidoreductase [Acetobacteraceae bacterium]|jgi:D-amino-acid dehydrogenase